MKIWRQSGKLQLDRPHIGQSHEVCRHWLPQLYPIVLPCWPRGSRVILFVHNVYILACSSEKHEQIPIVCDRNDKRSGQNFFVQWSIDVWSSILQCLVMDLDGNEISTLPLLKTKEKDGCWAEMCSHYIYKMKPKCGWRLLFSWNQKIHFWRCWLSIGFWKFHSCTFSLWNGGMNAKDATLTAGHGLYINLVTQNSCYE